MHSLVAVVACISLTLYIALSILQYCVHVIYMNLTNRVRSIYVHMRWDMHNHMFIVLFMHWCNSYLKFSVSWLDRCTYVHICIKVHTDIHWAEYTSSPMSGHFLLSWLYNAPVLFHVHIRGSNNILTALGLSFVVQ